MSQTESVLCQICREPIWNFLCANCISESVKKWLPYDISNEFAKHHDGLKEHFHTTADNFEPCLSCGLLDESPICPYCYTHEIYHWIKERSSDLARDFSKLFFFYPFEGSEIIKSYTSPIGEETNKSKQFGICDRCGECSESLEQYGEWLCEVCSD